MEHRVKELERSNEILRKQSTILNTDTANSNAQQNIPTQSPTTSYELTQMNKNQVLLNNIQDRVSNFVLRQIDSQLEKMEKEFEKNIVNFHQLNERSSTLSSQNTQQEETPHMTVPSPDVIHTNMTTSTNHLSKGSHLTLELDNLYTTCQNLLSPSDHHKTINILITRTLTEYQFFKDHNYRLRNLLIRS